MAGPARFTALTLVWPQWQGAVPRAHLRLLPTAGVVPLERQREFAKHAVPTAVLDVAFAQRRIGKS
jgi:hypothetical protein